ncbi:unnamed protein product [Lupinus luteus]|uniref:Uncharacterized protein n=1 Tax=Lupinus luteus TaxID=3873 RepID=A0AAV1WP67_LUPLU
MLVIAKDVFLRWGLLSITTILRIGLERGNFENGFPSIRDDFLLFIISHHMIT